MTVTHDLSRRSTATPQGTNGMALEDRFEVLKEIGDGSFGSVVLARVRSAGANVARRGTVVRFWVALGRSGTGRNDADMLSCRLPSRR